MYRIESVTHFISGRCLFDKVSITFQKGDRIGLVGANGAGKTTLLRIMNSEAEPDAGNCQWPASTRIGYLRQEFLELPKEQKLREFVMEAFSESRALQEEWDRLSDEIASLDSYDGQAYSRKIGRMEFLRNRLDVMDTGKQQARVEETLTGLGFQSDRLDAPLHTFSGGWQMRAILARMLLEAPDILLLDEPTNHLDIDSIEWLERYLPGYPGAVWIVSHDRFFLNRMVTHIAALQHRRITLFKGNYDDYEKQYEQRQELQQQIWENQQKEKAQAERFINRFRAKATKARQVQSRIRQLEKMETVEPPEDEDHAINFRFPDPPRSGSVVLSLSNLVKVYAAQDQDPVPVFTAGQDLQIERDDKIALIGINGAGKSTLARIVNGTEPFEGNRVLGHNVTMTFFAQHLADMLTSDRTVYEEMEASAKTMEARTRIRGILGAFLFSGDDVFKKVEVLSGGERNRLALAKSLLEPANFLILDEPTNHLDMRSKNVLLRALDQYQGTVLAISHDRFFLSGFANKIWRAGQGRVSIYPGDYAYYEWKIRQQAQEASSGFSEHSSTAGGMPRSEDSKTASGEQDWSNETMRGPKSREVKRLEAELRNRFGRERRKLKKELDLLEQDIDGLENEKTVMEEHLADPDFYQSGDAGEMVRKHAEVSRRLERKWNQWTVLSEEMELLEKRFESELEEWLNAK